MTRTELVRALAERRGIRRDAAREVVDTVLDAVVRALSEGRRVELRGFGVFSVRRRGAYRGRNPRTGERVDVTPKRRAVFRPSRALVARLDHLGIEEA